MVYPARTQIVAIDEGLDGNLLLEGVGVHVKLDRACIVDVEDYLMWILSFIYNKYSYTLFSELSHALVIPSAI